MLRYPLRVPFGRVLKHNPCVPFRPNCSRLAPSRFPSLPCRVRMFSSKTAVPPSQSRSFWLWALAIPTAIAASAAYKSTREQQQEEDSFDTEKLYASKPTKDIAFSWAILKLCSYNFVVEYGPPLMKWAESHYLATLTRWVMKRTFFKHFVAGETQEEAVVATNNLQRAGMGVVLDYSIEAGTGSKEELDKVAIDIVSTVHVSALDPINSFACLKVSGLTSFALLQRLSELIVHYNSNPSALPIQLNQDNNKINNKNGFEYSTRVLPSAPKNVVPPPLTPAEQQELNELVARLDLICRESSKHQVSVLFDAEQTYYQPAIDYLTLYFSKKYNHTIPIVYNTYQMYLKDGPKGLQTDINNAKKDGYILGVKLVRGAYMHTERRRAIEMNYPDPINPSINETHGNYSKGLEIAFANLPNVGVMIASHNEDTVVKTIGRLRELKVDPKNTKVQFAQLYGMGDHLSFLLVQNGFRVFKYVPYGPVEQVIPYLIRRMQENRGFIGSASDTERRLLWRELRRRLRFWGASTGTSPSPNTNAAAGSHARGSVQVHAE